MTVPRSRHLLPVRRFAQPDDVSCGPTCLRKVYAFWGVERTVAELTEGTARNPDGGTLAVHLAHRAMDDGFDVALYPFGPRVFDPTWHRLRPPALAAKLRARSLSRANASDAEEARAWAQLVERRGGVFFRRLVPSLLVELIDRGLPMIVGLSATWLYQSRREAPPGLRDDVHGEPVGHFVVVCGYTASGRRFVVRDPESSGPFSASGRYSVEAPRLISSILLGDATRDNVLLTIRPRRRR